MTILDAKQLITTAVESDVTKKIDFTALIMGIIQITVTLGLITWIYKVLTHQYKIQKEFYETKFKDLQNQLDASKTEIDNLKKSENRWFKKVYKLYNILSLTHSCSHNETCKVKKQFELFNEKEGEIV